MIDFDNDLRAVFADPAMAQTYTVTPASGGAAYTLRAMLDMTDTDALSGYALSLAPLLHYQTAAAPALALGDVLQDQAGRRWAVREQPYHVGDGLESAAMLGVAP